MCVRIGMPLLCRDTETDPRVDAELCRRTGIRSVAVAPMVRAGEPLGVLRVMSSEAEHFDDADVEVLELMANLMASGLSNTSKLDREAERALRDPLTGLANRFIFMDRLAHHGYEARRYGRPYGLFLIGLDRFSVVNESLGQEWGDAVLRSVAQGLNATVRGGDTLARLESDQFVVPVRQCRASCRRGTAQGPHRRRDCRGQQGPRSEGLHAQGECRVSPGAPGARSLRRNSFLRPEPPCCEPKPSARPAAPSGLTWRSPRMDARMVQWSP